MVIANACNDEITICRTVKYRIYRGGCIWYGTDPACDGISDHQCKETRDKENLFFSPNGVAGLVFYGFLVLTIVLYMTGHKTPGNIMMVIFLGIPVILFLLKEPLGQLVEGKKPKAEGGVGMFLVQGFLNCLRRC